MGDLVRVLGGMSPQAVEAVRRLETESLKLPQVAIPTEHVFHAGMYARTICIPADVMLTGALIKIPTLLILAGDALVYTEDGATRVTGHQVMLGAAGRKQAFLAIADTMLTMVFATGAATVEEAETEFTDEVDLLFSRGDDAANRVIRGVV
ncbi:MAG: hypothetical protein RBR34_11020 [Rhodospirillaceae bacterium]|nr:hypothetical protein [Rhodospirillaceae bacterium]